MKTLIIGAGGYIGSAVARVLQAGGHEVSGLARNPDVEARLKQQGYGALPGDLSHLPQLAKDLLAFDAVIFTPRVSFAEEGAALDALTGGLEGTGKTFIYLSGTGVMNISTPEGEWRGEAFGETDPFTPEPWMQPRVEVEKRFLASSRRGVRAMLLRPAHVWGHGGSTVFRALFHGIRKTGAAAYVGLGLNGYAHVHVDDLAELCRLVLERGEAGGVYNAVAGEMNMRTYARAAAALMKCDARSLTLDQVKQIWGEWMGPALFGTSCPARAPKSLALGWAPRHPDPEADIREGGYPDAPSMEDFEAATQKRLGVKAASAALGSAG